jgi:hypothetical protein
VFDDLSFGALIDAVAGRSSSLGHAVAHGALFATVMCVANLTILRRRTKRQSQRPVN